MAQLELPPVVDLIVLDEANPHAVIFQVCQLVRYLARLERGLGGLAGDGDDLRAALAQLRAFERDRDFSARDNDLALAALLDDLAGTGTHLSDRLAMRYFTHVGDVRRQTLAA